MSLKPVLVAWNKIASEPSLLKKEEIISESLGIDHFKHATFLALNNHLKFKVRDTDFVPSENNSVEYLWRVLSHLATKSGADAKDKERLNIAASIDKETVEAINRILKGDLRCGAGPALFRKYIPEIPEHKPMLCIDDLDKFINFAGSFENIATSIKLDGVRVWAVVEESGIKYISRNGKEYPNFNVFDGEVKLAVAKIQDQLGLNFPFILDGEVVTDDKDFQKCLSNFRRLKEADNSIFEFKVFDIVCNLAFIERYKLISKVLPKYNAKVTYVPHMFGMMEDKEEIINYLHQVSQEGEEGLVLKTLDGPYEYKRSNHWCKVKSFSTEDLEVMGLEMGTGRNASVLGALICDRNGVDVKVGSGFSDRERIEFLENPPEKIEVRYQNVTKDGSLRFPVFLRIRQDI